MDGQTVKIGLLMEAAQAQQSTIQQCLDGLHAHVRGLDEVVRDEVRDSIVAELQGVSAAANAAQQSLRDAARAANLRTALWAVGVTLLCSATSLGLGWWMLPSHTDIARLRETRDRLDAQVTDLEQRGARIDLRRCGRARRLCVRVDREAPTYGEQRDYLVVQGY